MKGAAIFHDLCTVRFSDETPLRSDLENGTNIIAANLGSFVMTKNTGQFVVGVNALVAVVASMAAKLFRHIYYCLGADQCRWQQLQGLWPGTVYRRNGTCRV